MTPAVWISILALVVSSLSFYLNRQQAEKSSWNTALSRVGQLYDQASQNPELATLLREPIDLEGKNQPAHFQGTPKQDVWLANLFMAYEQVYVAVSSASGDSKRAWKTYLKNQLNKPTIRLVFLNDALDCDDYHQHFIKFCFGKREKKGDYPYSGGAIDREIIKKAFQSPSAVK